MIVAINGTPELSSSLSPVLGKRGCAGGDGVGGSRGSPGSGGGATGGFAGGTLGGVVGEGAGELLETTGVFVIGNSRTALVVCASGKVLDACTCNANASSSVPATVEMVAETTVLPVEREIDTCAIEIASASDIRCLNVLPSNS